MKTATLKLYYTAGTRALRPRWLLEEMGLPYQLVPVDLFGGEGHSPEYHRIHPLGQVPALEVDGKVMIESGAICAWLTEYHPEYGLAPPLNSPLRLVYQQWMYFAVATLEPLWWEITLHTVLLPEASRSQAAVKLARHRIEPVLEVLDGALVDTPYIVGDCFTAADIMLVMPLLSQLGLTRGHPVLQNYVERMKKRPAYIRASAD